jgi:hypothetical protein
VIRPNLLLENKMVFWGENGTELKIWDISLNCRFSGTGM